MKKILLVLTCLSFALVSFAQVVTPFAVRKTITQKGSILYLSNVAVQSNPFSVKQNEIPPAGTGYNNNFKASYVDIDGDASTFMSSSDSLALAICSEITWAGLYWGAENSSGQENWATRNQVKLKANNGSYQDLTADYSYDNTVGYRSYHCFKDVTSILQSNGLNVRYTVANVAANIGESNLFGGWTIVVVYKNSLMTMRNLTVFDGLANVSSRTSTVDIPISGFQTPLNGPINFELGLVAYDGDRSLTGDSLLFKGGSSFVRVSNSLHNANDVFNSTISRNSVLTPWRNPSYNNTLGYDANIFSPDNSSKSYIGNNAVSATIRQKTGGETYLTQVVTSAIDVYEPDVRAAVRVVDLNGGLAEPGDTLEYSIIGTNIGSDPSINTYILDTLEGNAHYVPGSTKIIYGPNSSPVAQTDAAGDDQFEFLSASKVLKIRIGAGANAVTGGKVYNSSIGTDSTVITFRVTTTADCVYLACDNTINNSAYISGTGEISGNTYSNASNPGVFDANGCAISGATSTPINLAMCTTPPTASSNAPVCLGDSLKFTASYSPSATYEWSGPNGFSSTLREPSIPSVTAANSGIYTCHLKISGTPCDFEFNFPVVLNVANAGPDQTGSTTCGLTTVTLAGNSPAGSTGAWTIISGTGGSFGNATSATSTFTGIAGNSYTLRWTLTTGACPPSTDDVNITFNLRPAASVLSGSGSVCLGSPVNLQVAVTGGTFPYTVVLDNNGGTFTNYLSGTNIVVTPPSTTTFGLTSVTDAKGCTSLGLSGSSTVTITSSLIGTGTITELTAPVGTSSSKGPNFPSGNAVTNGTGTAWSNLGNGNSDNNSYITATDIPANDGLSQFLELKNFNMAIPDGATIDGIQVTMEVNASFTNPKRIQDVMFELIGGGGTSQNKAYPVGDNVANNWGANEVRSYPQTPSTTDKWGTTWTAAQVNSTSFGVRLRAKNTSTQGVITAQIDYVRIQVYYTTGSNSYCADATARQFKVSGYTGATSYTWTGPTGSTISSGQGDDTVTMNFNNAMTAGTYNVSVTTAGTCGMATVNQSIPIIVCGSTYNILGNVYWDANGSEGSNKVDGTGISTVAGSPLYATLINGSGTTAARNSVPVSSNGSFIFTGTNRATQYSIIVGTNQYSTGNTVVAALPSGWSYNGEINNNALNSLTGNDGTANGKLTFTSDAEVSETNVNFGLKVMVAPVANNDATTTDQNTPVTLNVTTNDTDEDGTIDTSTVILGSQTNGTWTVNPSGVVMYTPTTNFNGQASITYTVKDNDGNTSNTATLYVTVNFVNQAPVAVADSATTNQNTPVSFNIVTNDTDVDGTIDATTVDLNPATPGKQTTFTVIGQGTYNVSSSGVVTFTPVTSYYGPVTPVTYNVMDNLGLVSNSGTITVTVNFVNQAPVAVMDTITTDQDTPVSFSLTANDTDIDGTIDAATVDLDPYVNGTQTTFIIPGEGTYSVDGSGILTFTPDANFFGTASSLYYTVKDELGLTSNIANVSITVMPTGAPVAVNDSASTNANSPVTFNITNNDYSDSHTINASRVDLDPGTAGLQQSYYVANKGTFSVDINGDVTFQPDWNYYGEVTASYTVKDNLNLTSNIATIKVTVIHVNFEPTAVDDTASTDEDTPVIFSITNNDYDLDGIIDATSVDLDPNTFGVQKTFTVTGEGTYTVDNSGYVTFTPDLNFNGTATPIYYTVDDNEGLSSDIDVPAQIQITVNPVNDAPVAYSDIATALFNTAATFNITINDIDIDGYIDVTTVDLDTLAAGIQTEFIVAGQGTYTVNPTTGIVTFTPVNGFSGLATPVYYKVKDNSGALSNATTITVTVLPSGTPTANNDGASTNEDTPVFFTVTSNDVQGASPINVSTVDLDPSAPGIQTSYTVPGVGLYEVDLSGGVTFTPATHYSGTSSITYTVNDNDGKTSNPATITVTINPVNDAPSFTKGSDQSACANSDVQVASNWATSLSAGPANESSQTLSFVVTNNNNALFSVQPDIDASGNLSYTPAANQTGSATVSVSIHDNGGTANGGVDSSAIQTFTITVTPLPTITLGTNPSVCLGSTSASLTYSATTQSPTTYSIDFDIAAGVQGFVDVVNATLPPSPIVIAVPGSALAGTYNAVLTIKNGNSCISTDYNISVTITPTLTNNTVSGAQTICSGLVPNTITGSAPAGGDGTYAYTWLASTTSATDGFNAIASSNTQNFTPAALTQSTWYKRVVSSGACSNDTTTSAIAVTVNKQIAYSTAATSVSINYGTTLSLPTTVLVKYSDSTSESRSVTWDTTGYTGNAGTYQYTGTISLASGTCNSGNIKGALEITVTPLAITVTANDTSKVYGDADPALTYVVVGLVGADTLSGTLTRTSGESAGKYLIAQGTLAASANYTLTYISDSLTITPRAITITARDTAKVYGDVDPVLPFGITAGTLAAGDELSGEAGRIAGDTVGSYLTTIGNIGVGANTSNYTITFVADTFSVTPLAITVTASPKSKVYGNADPALTYSFTTGTLVGSDTLSGTITRTSGESAGKYLIAQGTLAASPNYTLTYVSDSLTITPRAITITARDTAKVYGDVDPVLPFGITAGTLAAGDELSGEAGRIAGDTVGSYLTTIGNIGVGANTSNYTITFVADTFSVTPLAITVTASPKSKVYGDADPALTYVFTSGALVGSDTLSGTIARTSGENVGKYLIAQGTLAASANYTLTYVSDSLAITPRAITITARDTAKVYGDVDPVLPFGITAGSLAPGDELSGEAGRIAGDTVGSYLTTIGNIGVGANTSNYTITFVADTFSVTPLAITVTADSKSKVYGNADPALTYVFTSGALVGSDTLSGTITRTSGESAGKYLIAQGSLAASANYTLTYISDSLIITPRAITITARDTAKVYGDVDPVLPFGITAGSLAAGDELSGEAGRIAGDTVGSYLTTIGNIGVGANTSNYTITFVADTFSVTPKAITVKADDKSKVYGNADPALTYVFTSGALVGSDTLSGTIARTSGESVGKYLIAQGSLAASPNYTLTYVSDSLTITPRAITITSRDSTKVYGSVDPVLPYSITSGSLASGDVLTGDLSRATGDSVGIYLTTIGSLTAGANYTVSFVADTFSVTPKAITVKADDKSKVYGNADPALTYVFTSGALVGSDTLSGTIARTSGESVGKYLIAQGTLAASPNYTLTYVSDSLTITPRAITITSRDSTKVYGSVDPVLPYSITAGSLASGDVLTGDLSRATGDSVGLYLTTIGSLTAGANYTVTFVADTFSVTPKAITVKADDKSKVYGDADPALTYVFTSGTLVGSDTLSGTIARTSGESVGKYLIAQGSLAASPNYTLTYVSDSLTITPRAITITSRDSTKVYGSVDPVLPYSITAGTLASGDVLTGDLSRATGDSVGLYLTTIGSLTAGANYTVTFVADTFSVTPKAITVKADDKSKVYGDADPALTYVFTSGTLVGSDTLSGTIARTSGESAGKYLIAQGSLAASPNYTLTYVSDSLAITPRAITITSRDSTKVYGSVDPVLPYSITSGTLAAGDVLTGDLSRATGDSVGIYLTTIGSLTAGANYTVTFVADTFSVTPKAITVKADDKSKVYGDADPALTYVFTSGALVGSDTLSGTITRTSGESAGKYLIAQGTLAASANYTLTYISDSLTITPRAITITARDTAKVYGDVDPVLPFGITAGTLAAGDELSGEAGRIAGDTVGTYLTTIGNIGVGANTSNYTITFVADTFSVTPLAITVTASPKSKVYGDADPALTYVFTSGALVGSDTLSGTIARTSGESVGKYLIAKGSLAASPNYTLTYVSDSLTITPRAITITSRDSTKVYGSVDPVLPYSITAGTLASGDVLTGDLSRATGDSVGIYLTTIGSLTAGANYTVTFVADTFSVTPLAITVTADGKSKVYGNADPALTYSFTSGTLVGSDTLSGTIARTSGESAGKYLIAQGTLAASANYTLTYISDSLTITPRAITITARDTAKVYGDVDPVLPFGITAGSLASGDELSGEAGRIAGDTVGSYLTTIGNIGVGANTSNYTITFVADTFSVTPLAITVTADSKSKVYGNADPALTYVFTSGALVGSDTLSGTIARTSGESVGKYLIAQGSLAASPNYTLTYVSDSLAITPRAITITSRDSTKVYGSVDPVLPYSITSGTLAAGDVLTGDLSRATGDSVGVYLTTIGSLTAGANYTVTFVADTFSVTPKAITVKADDKSKVYGDADPALTYVFTSGALVGSDTLSGTIARTSGESVGKYLIAQGSLAASPNYTLTYISDSLTITPKAVTVTAAAKSKVYGDADPALTYTNTPLAFTDAFTGGLSRSTGENIGKYEIAQGTLALSSNYTLTYISDSLTITPRAITITLPNITKRYKSQYVFANDGRLLNILLGAFLNGDSIKVASLNSTGSPSSAAVGTYAINIDPGSLVIEDSLHNNVTANYSFSFIAGTLTINQRVVNMSVIKTAGNTNPEAGDSITYTIAIHNNGPSTVDSGEVIAVHEQPETGLVIDSIYSTFGTFNQSTEELILNDSFASGNTVTVIVKTHLPVNYNKDSVSNAVWVQLPDDIFTTGDSTDTNTVAIKPTIIATNDDFTSDSVDGAKGGMAGNVFANDSLNGAIITRTSSDLTISVINNGGINGVQIDSIGNVIIPAGTWEGAYSVVYQICNANNLCDSATVSIKVKRGLLVTATSKCMNDVPYLHYKVTPNFTPVDAQPVTLTWLNGNGSLLAALNPSSNNPLEADILYAGTKPDINGNPTSWPGWCFNDGVWRQCDDGFLGVRLNAKLVFSVNPKDTLTFSYPPATPGCNAVPPALSRMDVRKRVISTGTYQNVGDTIQYAIVVENTGNVDLNTIQVIDSNATFVSPSTAIIDTLKVGDSAVVTARHIITLADMQNHLVNNTAYASATDTGNVVISDTSNTTSTTVSRSINLTVNKAAGINKAQTGDSIPYSISITNNGPSAIESGEVITILDQPAPGLTLGAFHTANGSYNTTSGALTLNSRFVQGQTIVLNVKAFLDSNYNLSSVTNTVKVKLPVDITFSGDSSDTAVVIVSYDTLTASIGLAKEASTPKVYNDGTQEITYTIVVKNYGNTELANVEVSDNLKKVFTAPATFSVVGNITSSGGLFVNNSFNGNTDTVLVDKTRSKLNAGQTDTIRFTVRVNPNGRYVPVYNTAYGAATDSSGSISTRDASFPGLNPDPNNDNSPAEDSATVSILVQPAKPAIVVPNGFSPNGDGVNDFFYIDNPKGYKLHLAIYNRWGNLIYENYQYDNTWGGTAEKGVVIGDAVPDGTYFYLLEYTDENDKQIGQNGFITINR